ncbi:MAG: hypothetical protein E7261_00295 [Lachnospiraceae bacterium]|nr:hypothetical protein [Lachnospiraceae bacterium]
MFNGNPIYKKEVGTGMRTARTAILIVGFNTILAIVAFVMFHNTIKGITSMGALDYSGLTNLYTVMVYIEFGIIAIIVPAITAGAVAGERERQTLDVMLASRISPLAVIWGKMLSCMQIIVVVCISSLPVLSIVFVYGGIRITNLLVLLFVIICTGFYFGSIGLFASSICKKTTAAVITAYVGMVAVVILTGGIVYIAEKLSVEFVKENNSFMEGISNIMLINPATTIVGLVGDQLETESYFEELLFYGVARREGMFVKNWTFYSVAVQLFMSTVLLFISAWILNPLKFGLWRRVKKIYEKRKDKKSVISG